MSYLERYLNGEHKAVWDELLAVGENVRQQPLYDDALAVARETMRRVRHNIELLYQRLTDIDYRFLDPKRAYRPPVGNITQALDRFKTEFGTIPLSLQAWFEIVGGVDFRGDHPDLCGYDGYPVSYAVDYHVHDPEGSFPYYADPLFFDDVEAAIFWLEDRPGVPIESEPPRHLIVPDWIMKAGVSGGNYEILLPNSAMDAPLERDPRNQTFVGYLRTSFRWGGFPGFELYSAPEFEYWRKKWHVQAEYEGVSVPHGLLKQLAFGLLPI